MAYTPHVINLSQVEDIIKLIVIIGIKCIMFVKIRLAARAERPGGF